MPLLDSCCGRWSLKTGTIISGILGVIIGAVTLVFVLTTNVKMQTIIIDTLPSHIDGNNETNNSNQLMSMMKKYEVKFIFHSTINDNDYKNVSTPQNITSELLFYDCIDNKFIKINDSEYITYQKSSLNSSSSGLDEEPFCLSDYEVKIILVINLIMTMLISVLLVIGALKRNRFMMLPWVILAIMLAIGLAISVIYTAVVFYAHGEALGGTLWLIFGLLSVAIYIYLWFVVFSFYQLLQEEKGRGPYDRSAYRR